MSLQKINQIRNFLGVRLRILFLRMIGFSFLRVTYYVLLVLFPQSGFSLPPDRIGSIHFDKGKVSKILMTPGLVTTLVFRCDIDEIVIGSSEDLKAVQSETSKKRINLFLSSAASLPTNLIIGCGKSNMMYVFDVIPSLKSHQDIVSVSGFYGGPGFNSFEEVRREKTDRAYIEKMFAAKPLEDAPSSQKVLPTIVRRQHRIPDGATLIEESKNE